MVLAHHETRPNGTPKTEGYHCDEIPAESPEPDRAEGAQRDADPARGRGADGVRDPGTFDSGTFNSGTFDSGTLEAGDHPVPRHPALEPPSGAGVSERRQRLDRLVFGIAATVSLAFVAWGLVSTASLGAATSSGVAWVVANTGWLFALVASAFVVVIIWLAAGRYGAIRLGRDDEEPEFSTVSWVAMMFSAPAWASA